MNRKFNELQVGLLTMLAVVVLIAGMMFLKNIDLRTGSHLYQVDFKQVEGLRVGDRVQVRGIRMGEVTGMAIVSGAVRVELELEESAVLGDDAVLTLGEKGIVGEVVIEIDPGAGAPVQEGHIFSGRTAGTIAAMTDAAGAALAEMRALTSQVADLVREVKEQGKVTDSLVQANETLDKIDGMIDDNHARFSRILDNTVATTDAMRSLMQSGRLERALDGTAASLEQADSLMISLGDASRRLDQVLTELAEGQGSAARLLNDPSLYLKADSALTSVHRLADELRRNPKKYLEFKLMDF